VFSAPVALLLVIVLLKLCSVVIAGDLAASDERDPRLRLNPDSGDSLERLQQILRDAAAAQRGGG
jgi:hypothetical protein